MTPQSWGGGAERVLVVAQALITEPTETRTQGWKRDQDTVLNI